MKNKWFCILGMMTLLGGVVLVAQATNMNAFAHCMMVPLAKFNASGETTVVGLSNRFTGTAHWLFYDQDGIRQDQGSFAAEEGVLNGFVMSTEVRADLAGTLGFLLFCLDNNADNRINFSDFQSLSGNAFQVDLAALDVAYIPTLPIFASNLDEDDIVKDVTEWAGDPIDRLSVGLNEDSGDQIVLQYLTDGTVGSAEETNLYIFTTSTPPTSVDMSVIVSGTDPTVSVALDRSRLNNIDVETIAGMANANVTGSGLLVWNVGGVTAAFAFSIAKSPAFGATQTLLGTVGFSDEGGFGLGTGDDEEDDGEGE